jgi:iodotyrosine deiodinase
MSRTRPYAPPRVPADEAVARLEAAYEVADARRSVRHFSADPVPRAAIAAAIRIAGTAPSGAHRQPWTFVAVSDPGTKAQIRAAAEEEERAFYAQRATTEWLEALAPLGTDFVKTHLTDAPWVVVVFRRDSEPGPKGPRKNYYVNESVGIAVGFFISALHAAGLATLPHTPAPMAFLRTLLGRPTNEKAYVVIPVGYPSEGCEVPDIARKSLAEFAEFREAAGDGGAARR